MAPSGGGSNDADVESAVDLASPDAYDMAFEDGDGSDDRFAIDFKVWRREKSLPFVRAIHKVAFVLGVLNFGVIAFFSGGRNQWFLPFYYSVKFPLLVGARFFTYRAQSWHFFLVDFCYFANLLLLATLWLFDSGELFIVTFSVINGPLLAAVPLFRNSLVFHSVDKTTSAFIHISPAVVVWVCRWFLGSEDPEFHDSRFEITVCRDEECSTNFILSFLLPVAFFAAHQIFYAFMIFGVCDRKIKNNPASLTTFKYLVTQGAPKGLFFRMANVFGPRFQKPMFCTIYTLFSAIIMLPTILLYKSFVAHTVVLGLVIVSAVYQGGNFYVEVFSRRYEGWTDDDKVRKKRRVAAEAEMQRLDQEKK